MCYHPIKIRNPSLYINPDIDKPFIEVPCGKCEQCVANKIEGLVTRGYYEWRRCVNKGGFAYFDTLTYSNTHVPVYRGEYIFSRKHLTDFLKRLRITLKRDGYEVTSADGPLLRYLITSEYGDNTHRPHYHVIWFVNIPGLTLFRFYYLVRKCWKHGFNDKITEVSSHVINRISGIRYVCKYVTKDTFYFTEMYGKMMEKYKDSPEDLADIMSHLPDIKPFYRASLGFGIDICKLDKQMLIHSGVPVGEADGTHFAQIPFYNRRKLFYDKVQHPYLDGVLYRRNEFGVQYLVENLENVIDYKLTQFKDLLNNESLYGSSANKLLTKQVETLLDGRDLRKYVIYKCVYQGHLFSDLSFEDYPKYYERWLTDPKELPSPFLYKSSTKQFINDPSHYIIDDRSIVDCVGFDEIDSIFDYLHQNRTEIKENYDNYKKQQTTRMHEICARFGLVS